MKKLLLLLGLAFLVEKGYSQTTDSISPPPAREKRLHPGAVPPHKRSRILLEKDQASRQRVIKTSRHPPLAPKTSAIIGQCMGSVFIAGGIVLFPVMHHEIRKARALREKYGSGGNVFSDVGRGIGVLLANAAVGGGTTMLILSTKKLNKLKNAGVSINAQPTGTTLVYNF